MEKQYIIIYGGVVSGLCFIGPFANTETAERFATRHKLVGWEIAELDHPSAIEDEP